jgi:hypothetical protein
MAELTPKLNEDGTPVLDSAGNPVMEEKKSGLQPKLDAEGNAVIGEDGKPVMEPVPEPAKPTIGLFAEGEDTSWIDTKKYGEDIPVAVKKQAKAYTDAVKEMQLALKERDWYKQQLEGKQPANNTPPAPIDIDNIPEEMRLQIQKEFGTKVEPEVIIAMHKLQTANLQEFDKKLTPALEFVYKQSWNMLKADLEKNNVLFVQYPDLMAKVEALPLTERIDMEKIKKIQSDFIASNLTAILADAELKGAKSVRGTPVPAGGVEPIKKPAGTPDKMVITLSKEQKEFINARGGNGDELERKLNTKPENVGWLTYAEK